MGCISEKLFHASMKVLLSNYTIFADMKATNILLIIVAVCLLPLYLTSCGEDRWAAYAEQTATTRWIDDTMRVWYYWKDELPESNQLNYFQAPAQFFASLLSRSDKYSYIDSLTTAAATRSIPDTDYSYGFQFAVGQIDGQVCAHVLYVAASSPADEAGLKRGDWILAMDGEAVTMNNYSRLFGGPSMQLTLGYYQATENAIVTDPQPHTLSAARAIDDCPVHYSCMLDINGTRTGYLVYNHFSAGATDNGTEYDNKLRSVFSTFASNEVEEFVLDLRYNNGGLVSCAQLLCTLLAPASALGSEMGYLEFNDRITPQIQAFTFNPDLIGHGANLNLKRLFVLTSSNTASASEMVINCLRPVMDVVLVGGTTVGKNVGSRAFVNTERLITMSPIICRLYNAAGESDYESGFVPDAAYTVDENSDMSRFLPFGDPDEALLHVALNAIAGGSPSDSEPEVSPESLRMDVRSQSIERRASGAVRIR